LKIFRNKKGFLFSEQVCGNGHEEEDGGVSFWYLDLFGELKSV
jgi:hypothetical protein